ncbi:MAG: hypothetical protein Q7P63_06695 [Verrucomicrobiota bacterium JB022]|nr:hypothetical protein [Verrucomicrobiota bacterium JB022]
MKSAKDHAKEAWEAAWRMRVERTAGHNERLRQLVKARSLGGGYKAATTTSYRRGPGL